MVIQRLQHDMIEITYLPRAITLIRPMTNKENQGISDYRMILILVYPS